MVDSMTVTAFHEPRRIIFLQFHLYRNDFLCAMLCAAVHRIKAALYERTSQVDTPVMTHENNADALHVEDNILINFIDIDVQSAAEARNLMKCRISRNNEEKKIKIFILLMCS